MIKIFYFIFFISLFLIFPVFINAQSGAWDKGMTEIKTTSGLSAEPAENIFLAVLDAVLSYLFPLFVILIIISGLFYILASGRDAKYVDLAKNILIYSIIGLVIALLAFVILTFLTYSVFGGRAGIGSSPLDPYFDF